MNEALFNEIRMLVSAQLGISLPAVRDRLVEDLGAKSADYVNIIASLEDRYQIPIDEECVQDLKTVGDLVAHVSVLRGSGA